MDIFEINEEEVIERKIKNQSIYPENCIVELDYEDGSIELKIINLPIVWKDLGELTGFRKNIKNGETIPIFKTTRNKNEIIIASKNGV